MILQFLTFELENITYAINVFNIQEVLEYEEPLNIPCSSALFKGIIRSRNTNIPIMDLRKKFELADHIPNKLTRIIVIEIEDPKSKEISLYGLITDKVIEVIDIEENLLEKVPKSKKLHGGEFVTSIISIDNKFTLVLDVNKIFSDKDINEVKKSSKKIKREGNNNV